MFVRFLLVFDFCYFIQDSLVAICWERAVLFLLFYFMPSNMCVFLSHLVSRAGCGIRLYRFLINAFSTTSKKTSHILQVIHDFQMVLPNLIMQQNVTRHITGIFCANVTILFCLFRITANGQKEFDFRLDSEGAYALYINSKLWLENGPTFFNADGKTWSVDDPNNPLVLRNVSSISGGDVYEKWQERQLTYSLGDSDITVTAAIRIYTYSIYPVTKVLFRQVGDFHKQAIHVHIHTNEEEQNSGSFKEHKLSICLVPCTWPNHLALSSQ